MISRSDWTGEVEDIDGNRIHVYAQSETSYGEAAGLFGVNCKHYPMTFIPGFSALRGEPQDPEENAETYALSQQQRAMERKLREEKRDLAVMKAQGADEAAIQAQRERVNRASAQIDDFCDEHGLPRRRNREYMPFRATWPDENGGQVTRFDGGYIDANAVPPEKGGTVSGLTQKVEDAMLGVPKTVHQVTVETMPTTLTVNAGGAQGVIPAGATIEDVVIIAGRGTSTSIRDQRRLESVYPELKNGWSKKSGTVKGNYYAYQVHWYENGSTIPEDEIKGKGLKRI